MSEVTRIVDQMQRAFSGEAWHGPALRELLLKISAQQAVALPFPNVHSIWEIVLHVAGWKGVVLRRLRGEAVDPPPEQDWPAAGIAEEARWAGVKEALLQAHQDLVEAVSQCPESRLAELVPGQQTSIYAMLHGAIQHDLYHAGQIAILHRAQI